MMQQTLAQDELALTSRNNCNKLKKNKSETNFASSRSREQGTNTLYEDAKRRKEALERQKKHYEKLKEETINASKPPAGANNNSLKYAA